MSDTSQYRYTPAVAFVPLFLVLAIWTVFSLELRLGTNWNAWGIFPRTLSGLRGIPASPWIHGSLEHLYNNTLPLAVLSAALFFFYRGIAWRTLILGILLSGLFTWIIGRPSYHIGASGLIYVLASFIFFKGIFTRYYRLVALSLGVVFIYGSLLWYIFPVVDEISWEGHLGGFLTGLLLAAFLKSPVPREPKFAWESEDFSAESDPFMRHFDEDGNFIEDPGDQNGGVSEGVEVRYHYRKHKADENGD